MRRVLLADGLVHDAYDTKFPHWCDTVCALQDWNKERDRTAGEVMPVDEPVTCMVCVAKQGEPRARKTLVDADG